MISLMCCNSRLSTVALIFYVCVRIPYLQLKRAVLRMLGFVFTWCRAEENSEVINVCLRVARFEDLRPSSGSRSGSGNGEIEEVCSICLTEFEKEDVVSQLQKCGHVFHMQCIEKWLDRHQFTCPLCRSFLFANINSSHAKCGISSPAAFDSGIIIYN